MTRFEDAFESPALIGYLVGNHPTRETFLTNASTLIDAGVDVLEVGIPFSDPIADGPTIQTAVTQALNNGVRPPDVLEACSKIRQRHPETPLVVMTYANIAYRMRYDVFADRLREHGIDGAILADLPPEAADEIQDAFGEDLALIFLASPATDDARLARLAEQTRGFLYVVGRFGTTGARSRLDPRTVALVERVKPIAETAGTPVAVGFGLSTGDHAQRLVQAGADGIVVGSAFIQTVLDGDAPEGLAKRVEDLVAGIDRAQR